MSSLRPDPPEFDTFRELVDESHSIYAANSTQLEVIEWDQLHNSSTVSYSNVPEPGHDILTIYTAARRQSHQKSAAAYTYYIITTWSKSTDAAVHSHSVGS